MFRVCGARQNFCVFSVNRKPELDDQVYDCLFTSMAAVQAEDVQASFLFLCEPNGHHQKWLGNMTKNRHGVATFDLAIMSGYDPLVVGTTHARGGTVNLLMVDVPDPEWRHRQG